MFQFFKKIKHINLVRHFHLERLKKPILFLIALCFFFLFQLFISTIALRVDLSKGKAYTLSDSSKGVLRNLEKPVTITFFVSSDLPTRLLPLKGEVSDFLEEYKKEGKGKIQIKISDPKKDQNALKQVQEAGIPELQLSQLEQDRYSVSTSYFGMTISYEGKKEVLPQVTNPENLEYDLTASIYKLARKEVVKLGLVGASNLFDPQGDALATLKKILQQQFQLDDLNIATDSGVTHIETSLKTILVFVPPGKEYDSHEIDVLKNYLAKNGSAIFFVDGVSVSDNLTAEPAKHNLSSLISDYGINVEKNLILSSAAELVNFGSDQYSFLVPYPFWVKANNFANNSYFSNISQLMFPWVSSLTVESQKGATKELVKTVKQSWSQTGVFTLNPQEITEPQEKNLKEFTILAEGSRLGKGRIVVIPSSRFVQARYLGNSSGNVEFVLNVVNDLASGGALSGIRSRAVSFYPVPDLPENLKDIFKYANILLLPVFFALWGALRLFKRR